MKINRGLLVGLVAGVSVYAVSSCTYDPYYSSASYSGGYGHGYGYGSSGFSTSVFVSTGNPRWGYDPYAGCYYDYTRRTYYDPHLCGYYPVGYRPRFVYGAPHPGGWTHGRGYCPPPSRIHSHTLTNYDNRAERYRSLNRDWSSNVRVRPTDNSRETRQHGNLGSHGSTFPLGQESGSSPGRRSIEQVPSGDRRFTQSHTRVTAPDPSARTRNFERREGSTDGQFPGRQSPPQIERPAPQQRFDRPAPERRIEQHAPTELPQARPDRPVGNGNDGGSPRARGGNSNESRGRGRDIRSLGEG